MPTSIQPAVCLAQTLSGASNEQIIYCWEAFQRHGISVRHGIMSTNGEMRFRLNATDGSAYIRTQTANDCGGWQNSHSHKKLRETYIVERGWIGYAELRQSGVVTWRYESGEIFTTEPGVVHNIFMPSDSVIHTVKHGAPSPASGPDWIGADKDARAKRLDDELVPKGEFNYIFAEAGNSSNRRIPGSTHMDPDSQYNGAYRHFDSLIWQVPSWSTALFTVVVLSVNALLLTSPPPTAPVAPVQTLNSLATLLGLTTTQFAGAQLFILGLITAAFSYALYRFRWHQLGVKSWARGADSPLLSPQVLLQIVVSSETVLLLFTATALFGASVTFAASAATTVLLAATLVVEIKLSRRSDWLDQSRAAALPEAPKTSIQGAS